MIGIFLALIAVLFLNMSLAEIDKQFIWVFVFIIFVVSNFAALTVKIDEEYLRVIFGFGLIRNKFKLSEMSEVKAVKNPWYYGWGIRYRMFPKLIIFNVSGFDAIEFRKGKNLYRVGTDDPKKLEETLKKYIK